MTLLRLVLLWHSEALTAPLAHRQKMLYSVVEAKGELIWLTMRA